MNVELVRMTENPVEAIELAASNCYDSTPSPDGRIMKACYKSGHHSVLEFCQMHFHIEGVSRSLLAQLTRHRTFSFAVRSQRYVKENNFEYVMPKSIANNEFCSIVYKMFHERVQQTYDKLLECDIPAEDARYILPNSCYTVVDVSCDLRNFIHFCNERLCTRAQWEIRELAQQMRDLVVWREPLFADFLVPKCEKDKDKPFCPEHKSCGRH